MSGGDVYNFLEQFCVRPRAILIFFTSDDASIVCTPNKIHVYGYFVSMYLSCLLHRRVAHIHSQTA